ncbi:877_t:CDS:2 [Dentiscutata erythropus]|uniref:877_t:CDS:1 n=1 Tax=Dentiscutata erythropus TaxID=1348616 RepID=A0A9N9N837_9GLOM|nr:877_t:CDS:2 [Dentiscutata erythropus]
MSPKECVIIQVCGIHCGSPIESFRMNAQFAKDRAKQGMKKNTNTLFEITWIK